MKLEKFYAESMSQAMTIIQKKLGPDAVIYSQVKSDNFIEVVAGLPATEVSSTISLPKTTGSVKTSLDDRSIQIKKINSSFVDQELEMIERRNLLHYRLRQLKFSHSFIDRFIDAYSSHCAMEEIINDDQIIKMLLSKIRVEDHEFIDEKKVCALIGPTGVGKSTTIAKLAKRFIARYGNEGLGIISTDFQRIITKNQFYYFGRLLNVQIEYARTMQELQQAIHLLHNKRLILIDTAGVNQKDNQKIAELFQNVEVDNEPISLYLILPCNLQTEILNDVVTNFNMPNTQGCIITKKDECKSIAPCLSVILNHNLNISYVCGGQNISKDIDVANKINLVHDVFWNN